MVRDSSKFTSELNSSLTDNISIHSSQFSFFFIFKLGYFEVGDQLQQHISSVQTLTDITAKDLTSTKKKALFYFTKSTKYEHVLGLKNEDSF